LPVDDATEQALRAQAAGRERRGTSGATRGGRRRRGEDLRSKRPA
jgi:hypothetical protein